MGSPPSSPGTPDRASGDCRGVPFRRRQAACGTNETPVSSSPPLALSQAKGIRERVPQGSPTDSSPHPRLQIRSGFNARRLPTTTCSACARPRPTPRASRPDLADPGRRSAGLPASPPSGHAPRTLVVLPPPWSQVGPLIQEPGELRVHHRGVIHGQRCELRRDVDIIPEDLNRDDELVIQQSHITGQLEPARHLLVLVTAHLVTATSSALPGPSSR